MKEKLITNHCTSRKKIDLIAKNLNLSCVGSRDFMLLSIKTKSYSEIKKAISMIN